MKPGVIDRLLMIGISLNLVLALWYVLKNFAPQGQMIITPF